ncbi:MAG: hypothetical protein CMJ76_09795 [Planctomycetaceae bacterium]|nr:hypothetical protein [Planctomycetaceae bacterium]|tara:strand:+ start:94 stop:897 length:804 start_codon:yes stop_codon:yes gene_type:complete
MSDPLFSVTDQIVIISGGSRGIGKAIAEGFAVREAHTIITGRDGDSLKIAVDEITQAGATHPVLPIVCDVSKSGDITALVETVMEKYGRIDTLINVAGVNRRKPSLEITEDDYDFVMNINLKGAFQMSCAIGKVMIKQHAGAIVNIESLNTLRPLKNVLPYAMSKSALGHMTKGHALEWGEHGVRVNGLAPGFILTDLTQKLWSLEQMQQWGKINTPQRRLGTPQDMVGTALFLASEASAFLTGQTIYVDGGYTCGWNWPIPEGGGQ